MAKRKLRNRISEHRKKRRMSLRALADAVALRIDHHALFESDCHAVPIHLAEGYAEALNSTVDELFPGTARLLKKLGETSKLGDVGLATSNSGAELRAKGLDFSAQRFWISLEMRGGCLLRWFVASEDVAHVLSWLDSSGDAICFDTLFTRVLLRKKHAVKITVGWEPVHHLPPPSDEFVLEHVPTSSSLSVWTGHSKVVSKIHFDYEAAGVIEDVNLGQIEDFFWFAEATDDFDNDESVNTCFLDFNGEYVWINRVDIAAAETPLINVSAALYALYFSGDYDHDD